MATNIQIFAMRQDFLDSAHAMLDEHPRLYVLFQNDCEYALYQGKAARQFLADFDRSGTIIFSVRKPDLFDYENDPPEGRIPHYFRRNVDFLSWDLAPMHGRVMQESHVFVPETHMRGGPVWKRALARLRKNSTASTWGLYLVDGGYTQYKVGRFGTAAIAAELKGQRFKQFKASPMLIFPTEERLLEYLRKHPIKPKVARARKSGA